MDFCEGSAFCFFLFFFNVKKGCIYDISTEQNFDLHPARLSNVVLDIQGLN